MAVIDHILCSILDQSCVWIGARAAVLAPWLCWCLVLVVFVFGCRGPEKIHSNFRNFDQNGSRLIT
jgi:hypothetical protein